MRIARVDASWVRIPIEAARQHRSDFGQVRTFDAALVRIETACGLVGWGEGKNAAGSAGIYAALVHLINREIAPRLIGRDPREPSVIWDWLYSGVRHHHAVARGHVMPEIARRGSSIAALSRHRHRLLGHSGQVGRRADLATLRRPQGRAPAGLRLRRLGRRGGDRRAARRLCRGGGFKAVKMRVGAMDGPASASAARVKAARRRLGPAIELMVDAHGTFTVAEAKRFAHLVADQDLAWFEEPVVGDDKAGMAEVRRAAMIPIAAGESEQTRFDFRDLVEARRGRYPAARPGDLRRPHRGAPDRCPGGGPQSAARAASVGGRAGLLRRPASRRRQPVEFHPRIFARRQSDAARSHRRDGRCQRWHDRHSGAPGPRHHRA